MRDNDTKFLAEAYSKVLIKEERGKFLEIGYTSNPLPDVISLEINGQTYIVSGELDITPDVTYEEPEYDYFEGRGRVQTYAGGEFAGDNPNIKIKNISIQIPEMVKTKNSLGIETEEEKYVYDIWEGKLKINELEDKPDVIEAAKEALINKGLEYYKKNSNEFL